MSMTSATWANIESDACGQAKLMNAKNAIIRNLLRGETEGMEHTERFMLKVSVDMMLFYFLNDIAPAVGENPLSERVSEIKKLRAEFMRPSDLRHQERFRFDCRVTRERFEIEVNYWLRD